MDLQRALLDELMGRNRDGDKPHEDIQDFRDERVCKRFLCGLCPHDLFQNTKMDLGDCPMLHLPKLKAKYDETKKNKPDSDFGYEMALEKELLKFIQEVEKKIQRAQKRLEETDGFQAPSLSAEVENCKEVLEITAEIQETMQKAEEAGNEGEVDLSMELMQKVEELKEKKATAQANAMLKSVQADKEAATGAENPQNPPPSGAGEDRDTTAGNGNDSSRRKSLSEVLPNNRLAKANVNQKLRVCDVCGAFLSIFDSDRRLADHFGGKLHLGYLQIRKKIEEIAEARRERRRVAREQSGDKDKAVSHENRNHDNNINRPRGRQDNNRRQDRHSKSRSGSRSRSRSRSRRDRDRSHRSSRRHRRDRSRDRSRERSRSDRDRRDRDRDHDRGSRRHRRRSSSHSRSHSRSRSRGRRHWC